MHSAWGITRKLHEKSPEQPVVEAEDRDEDESDEDERNEDERYEDGRDEDRNEERETEQARGEWGCSERIRERTKEMLTDLSLGPTTPGTVTRTTKTLPTWTPSLYNFPLESWAWVQMTPGTVTRATPPMPTWSPSCPMEEELPTWGNIGPT